MSCNLPFFQKEEKAILQTWGKDIIDGKYPNIKIAFYSASADGKHHYNKKEHKLLVPSGDDLHSTFEKTRMTFNLINEISELAGYDFILRTNCSTYINVKLLSKLLELDLFNEDTVYCGNIDCNPTGVLPINFAPHPMGSCMILSKKLVSIIANPTYKKMSMELCHLSDDEYFKIDDIAIGSILNCYWLNGGENMLEHYQQFGLESVYASVINNIPLDDNCLCYSLRIYGATAEKREEIEINNIFTFHEKFKDVASDDILFITRQFYHRIFKMLFPDSPQFYNMEQISEFYKGIFKKEDKKKIYISGCGGMLGDAFYNVFKNDYILKCTDKAITSDWLSYCDFRDFDNYKKDITEFKPDYLFHLGAYTDLEWCENNIDETFLVNAKCVENAVNIANELDIPILYISTAGIFDGNKEFYDEDGIPNPLDIYAKAKYAGEQYVIQHAKKYLICRAGWMMGGGPNKDKKFINKMMNQIKSSATELYVVNDKDGTPTYTYDFAETVKALIENEHYGLYNCTCKGLTSRFEVAQEMLKILNLENSVKLIPVSSDYFKEEYFAPRPACERLISKKLDDINCNKMRDWKIALNEYLTKFYK
ncbi:MAG: nucleotide-sugar epimerase [Wendovervirus sonii]|uniref:Nucleotide-sugar epimerase n=1 Tax=phage Lak_Megaphage_Sonny TaxID=3109229 RepID=A0ABZ0Z5X6_9CAUD|nr:MAG: nucleotide-sugar epimerase [phage Lak_Megaphage_Sonny]